MRKQQFLKTTIRAFYEQSEFIVLCSVHSFHQIVCPIAINSCSVNRINLVTHLKADLRRNISICDLCDSDGRDCPIPCKAGFFDIKLKPNPFVSVYFSYCIDLTSI